MHVLVVNSGSSSLKVQRIRVDAGGAAATLQQASIEEIGGPGTVLHARTAGDEEVRESAPVSDHADAVRRALDALERVAGTSSPVDAAGHRVVHGGSRFRRPVRINDRVEAALEELTELAPLHNPPALAGIRGVRRALGDALPMVAVFDTAFFADLPPRAATYAIPRELATRHGVRRYGFHGIAHGALVAAYTAATGRPADGGRVITLQLGNGCSVAAVAGGRPVDTSMGFTPLEGLVMGTRSGDLDPAVVGYLARRERVGAGEVERWLNERSGLLGVSGFSGDMREVLAAAGDDPGGPAALALDLFCYRARKYVGAYLAALGGAEAVVFGGGIGERSPEVRERIAAGMDWCGLRLDPERNRRAVDLAPGAAARISADSAALAAYAAAPDEETEIARQTVRCLQHPAG